MELLSQSNKRVNRVHYRFQLDNGIIINYVRLEGLDGDNVITIMNKNWHPLDSLLDSKIIEAVKSKVASLEL